ncbi:MAG: hypothetical protein RUMPE_01069 [Eubacteriales bacterium SKADARSKE-1]|nr:hypothetical protein [Eubacteriales bacterium SKADARSKE-1]
MGVNLFGCKIKISFPFVAIIVTLMVIDKSLLSVLGILSAAIHEFGHLIAMKSRGYVTKEINMDFFNINIVDHNIIKQSSFDDIVILIFGPLFNLFSFIIFFALYNFVSYKVFLYFSLENLFLALFNLLPVYSLDGGQILLILLTRKIGAKNADKILNIISIAVIFPITAAGFYILLISKCNFSLLLISFYLIVILVTKKDTYL